MSGAAREAGQADFDLERFINMFDEAMTSKDPRVIETLRSLLMIVTLTRPEDHNHGIDRRTGPLRQMYDDVRQAHRRISDLEDMFKMMTRQISEVGAEGARSWPEREELYKMKAAAQMAQQIDHDVLRQLSKQTNMAINGGQIKGLYNK